MEEILVVIGFLSIAGAKKIRSNQKHKEMDDCLDRVEGLGDFLELRVIVREVKLREQYLEEKSSLPKKIGLSMEQTVRRTYLGMLINQKRSYL